MDSCLRSFSLNPSFFRIIIRSSRKEYKNIWKATFLLIQIYICIFHNIIILMKRWLLT